MNATRVQGRGTAADSVRMRPATVFSSDVQVNTLPDGSLSMRSAEALQPFDVRMGDWIDRWAREAPERDFLVEQTAAGERRISYREARHAVRSLAAELLRYSLSAERPLAILASAGIDHALLMCAALYIGVPVAPIAPAYALQSRDFVKLRRVMSLLTPGLVVVERGDAYREALQAGLEGRVPVVALTHAVDGQQPLATLPVTSESGAALDAVDAAASRVGPQTIAKFLFTSGSTGISKAVINTHGMLCAAAQMQRQVTAFIAEQPPVMVDWLPWNHTAGGNNIFNIILQNGGTLYIDPGRPDPSLIEPTLRLLRRISPTLYFNVPLGFEALLPHLRADRLLRETFFRDLKFLWYAAAPMQPSTWRMLEELAVETTGERIFIATGLGMTETSPLALFGNKRATGVGVVGVPAPGLELKLVPCEDKFEALYRGPNVTPGYWRDPQATRAAFDAEGYFRSGDLLSFVDEGDASAGLRFEGRASDDFKLTSGTRVAGARLRLAALDALSPLITEVVVVGSGRQDVRLLMFPDWQQCGAFCGAPAATPTTLAADRLLNAELCTRLRALASTATGRSNRIVAGLLVTEPPSATRGELTEKGTVNGNLLQRNRPELLEELFDARPSPRRVDVD